MHHTACGQDHAPGTPCPGDPPRCVDCREPLTARDIGHGLIAWTCEACTEEVEE